MNSNRKRTEKLDYYGIRGVVCIYIVMVSLPQTFSHCPEATPWMTFSSLAGFPSKYRFQKCLATENQSSGESEICQIFSYYILWLALFNSWNICPHTYVSFVVNKKFYFQYLLFELTLKSDLNFWLKYNIKFT